MSQSLHQTVEKWRLMLDDRLLILKNEQNLGLTKSLNRGIQHIATDLIARMDSDDISEPKRFERQVTFLKAHPDIHVVGGQLVEFDDQHECIAKRTYPTCPDEICSYICKASPLAHPTVMMRRQMFDVLKYDERYRTSQDIALWFDVLAAGFRIANLGMVTLRFRRDATVYKRRSRAKAWNEFRIYMHGIRRLYGPCSFRYLYPLSRFLFRLLPVWLVRMIYNSGLRIRMLNV